MEIWKREVRDSANPVAMPQGSATAEMDEREAAGRVERQADNGKAKRQGRERTGREGDSPKLP